MGLDYRDLEGLLKNTVHVDAFESKMGDDEDVIVLSFFVRDREAADDLVTWFERGYDWVLDAESSPGELKPGRFLVYVEIRRTEKAADLVDELLSDLNTLADIPLNDWILVQDKEEYPYSKEIFKQTVPLTPEEYNHSQKDHELNEFRVASGIQPKRLYAETAQDVLSIQRAAGIL